MANVDGVDYPLPNGAAAPALGRAIAAKHPSARMTLDETLCDNPWFADLCDAIDAGEESVDWNEVQLFLGNTHEYQCRRCQGRAGYNPQVGDWQCHDCDIIVTHIRTDAEANPTITRIGMPTYIEGWLIQHDKEFRKVWKRWSPAERGSFYDYAATVVSTPWEMLKEEVGGEIAFKRTYEAFHGNDWSYDVWRSKDERS